MSKAGLTNMRANAADAADGIVADGGETLDR
jgi:hypothetical protein